ncbi:MAG: ankyrin repeat domain-containing protein [Kiloniellales bacterium]
MKRQLTRFAALLVGILLACPTWVKAGPLHEAAMAGDAGQVEQLLHEGADINASDAMGTALHWAIMSGQPNVVQLLLARGAEPNATGPLGTPLFLAAVNGNTDAVALLLEHGADPNGLTQAGRSTPLHEASHHKQVAIVGLLLEAGADPNVATLAGDTPLHNAAKVGSLEIAQRLVDHGADVNAINAGSQPPLHLAKRHEHKAMGEFLMAQGAATPEVTTISELLGSADLEKGKAKAGLCTSCHPLVKGQKSIGPSLWNIVNRPKSSLQDFDYSPAMRTQEGVWTYQDLNAFIAYPAWSVPGTRMEFSGISEPQDRADLIAYLRTLSDSLVPMPQAD